jgi:hypothetical protein
VPGRVVVLQLLDFMLAQHREILLCRKLALAEALACGSLSHDAML